MNLKKHLRKSFGAAGNLRRNAFKEKVLDSFVKLPRISGVETIKALAKIGYKIDRQRGSHIMLYAQGKNPLSVPNHSELDAGTLRKIIRSAGISVEEFIELL